MSHTKHNFITGGALSQDDVQIPVTMTFSWAGAMARCVGLQGGAARFLIRLLVVFQTHLHTNTQTRYFLPVPRLLSQPGSGKVCIALCGLGAGVSALVQSPRMHAHNSPEAEMSDF